MPQTAGIVQSVHNSTHPSAPSDKIIIIGHSNHLFSTVSPLCSAGPSDSKTAGSTDGENLWGCDCFPQRNLSGNH